MQQNWPRHRHLRQPEPVAPGRGVGNQIQPTKSGFVHSSRVLSFVDGTQTRVQVIVSKIFILSIVN